LMMMQEKEKRNSSDWLLGFDVLYVVVCLSLYKKYKVFFFAM
jgi:hypothetical protein